MNEYCNSSSDYNSYSKQAFPVINRESDKRYCFGNDLGLLQSSREMEVKRGQSKDKLVILAVAVKVLQKSGSLLLPLQHNSWRCRCNKIQF